MTTALGAPRWRGQPGRLEVWYLPATAAATTRRDSDQKYNLIEE